MSCKTPTPRRFLPAKNRTTPAPLPQFQSTPRFGSSSAPRPTQTRESLVEDVDDGDDDDDNDQEDGFTDSWAAAPGARRRLPYTQDSIEAESEGASTSQGGESESPDRGSDLGSEEQDGLAGTEADAADLLSAENAPLDVQSSPGQRQAKRRKISISPVGDSSPLPEHYEDAETVSGEDDDDGSESAGESDLARADAGTAAAEPRQAQQPVFRPAPRFKPTDDDDAAAAQGILPAAFSPQRRGARYLPGGLAGELQGWLSEVKGWDGADKAATTPGDDGNDDATTLRIVVDEVRPGRHMHLVRGRAGAEATARGFILAGQGRLTGLGSRAVVAMREGSVVMVGPPVWDAEMDGGVWTVACDWRVV